MRRLLIILLSIAFPAAAAGFVEADPGDVYDTFTFYWENDLFAKTDRYYTNGLKLTWSTPYQPGIDSPHLPEWSRTIIRKLPSMKGEGTSRSASIAVGQEIYTPADTQTGALQPNDRPYAGYTYLETGFHGMMGNTRANWELQAGVIGPLSRAEQATSLVHRTIGVALDKGWSHQLKNEPALEAVTEYQWRFARENEESRFQFDFVTHLGGAFGNVRIYANAGAEARFGRNLPSNFGTCPIRPGCESNTADEAERSKRFGWHLFGAVDVRAVIRDIFLDGNTFRNSPSVRKNPVVADVTTGVAVEHGRFKASYAYVLRTKEFRTQQHYHIFGSINISWTY